jgi:hypothetical protein
MKSRALSFAALALLVGLCGWTEVRPAAAQALDAGKPPAQIFSGTCAACHRSPRGLVRSVAPGSLPGFLRQHYTTGNDMAGTMAAYVLGSGGTDRVAEPPPKREPKEARPEPKQRAKSDTPELAARNPDQKELSKSAKQRAAKKGPAEPPPAAKDTPASEPEKTAEPAKPDAPAAEQAKADAVECKVEEPAKQAAATAEDGKPPRQPAALLTLPGFPAPEPEPEPVAAPAAPALPGCDPVSNTSTAAVRVEEAPKEQQKEQPAPAPPPAVAEAPKTEPLPSAVTEAAPPALDILQEEVHAPRPQRTIQQKKRPPPQ